LTAYLGEKMTDFADELIPQALPEDDKKEKRREWFRYANASLALEGMFADKAQLARQERVIQGTLTTEEAIAECIEQYREDN